MHPQNNLHLMHSHHQGSSPAWLLPPCNLLGWCCALSSIIAVHFCHISLHC